MSIDNNAHIDGAVFTAKVNGLKSLYSSPGDTVIVFHVGELDHGKINSIASVVENKLEQIAVTKKAIKKIFNIVVETLQNIHIHGEKDEKGEQVTYFMIGKKENEYNIHSGNLVKTAQAQLLRQRLSQLKSLNEQELKKEYMSVLTNGELSAKGGAGLGFITIAIKSDNTIDFEFQDVNKEYALFSLHSKVKE